MLVMVEAVAQMCSAKKVFLEISQYSQKNTCAGECKRLSRHRLLFIMILQSSTNKKDYLADNYSNYNLIGKVSHTLN